MENNTYKLNEEFFVQINGTTMGTSAFYRKNTELKLLFVDLYKGGLYKKPLLRQEFFTAVICISRKRNGIRQKTMLLQQNFILLLDGKQNR